jgi:predicted nucleotidyltransferase
MSVGSEVGSNVQIFCEKEHSFLLKDVASSFRLNESDILSIYVSGSHLWESCRGASDWDLVVVVKSTKRHQEVIQRIKRGNFDSIVIEQREFLNKLKDHELVYLLPLWGSGGLDAIRTFDGLEYFHLSEEVGSLCVGDLSG